MYFYTEKNRGGYVIEIQDGDAKTGKGGAVYSVPYMRDRNVHSGHYDKCAEKRCLMLSMR